MASIIVKNVNAVSESLEQMASYNQKLYQEVEAIGNVCNKISSAWISGENDYQSTIDNLNRIRNDFETNIEPVLSQFVKTMNTYLIETQKVANRWNN